MSKKLADLMREHAVPPGNICVGLSENGMLEVWINSRIGRRVKRFVIWKGEAYLFNVSITGWFITGNAVVVKKGRERNKIKKQMFNGFK